VLQPARQAGEVVEVPLVAGFPAEAGRVDGADDLAARAAGFDEAESRLVAAMTRTAQRLLRGPNARPLPSQRISRKKVADAQAKTKVRARATDSRDMRYSMLSPTARDFPKA
jgi:hypothetical protein